MRVGLACAAVPTARPRAACTISLVAVVTNTDAMVDAALTDLDTGETVTLPSVEDTHLRVEYQAAAKTMPSANDHPLS